MFRHSNLGDIFKRWGGGTSAFFAYVHGSHDLCPALLAPLLPLIRADLGLSYLQSGVLLAAYTITVGLSQFLGGWLGDRLNRWTVIAIGLSGVGMATMAFGFSSTYSYMLIILIVMGIFAGAYHPSAMSLLYSHSEEGRGGKVLGLHQVGGSLAYAMGPILGGLIADKSNWHFAFIILGIPALAAASLVLRKFAREKVTGTPKDGTPGGSAPPAETNDGRIGIFQALRPIAIIMVITILSQFVVGTAMAFLPMYLVDKYSVAPVYAALLMGLLRGGGIGGSLLGGWLSDRWDRRNSVILVLAVTGPFLYLLIMLPFNAFFMLALVIFGIISIMRQSTMQPYLMHNTPPYLRATIMGIYLGLGMEGTSLIQPLAGHYMDIFGIVKVFNFIGLIGVVLSLLLLALTRINFRR